MQYFCVGAQKDRMSQIDAKKLTSTYIGNHDMFISAIDSYGNLIDRKKVTLVVVDNEALTLTKNILCIGDSLTNNGLIVSTCGEHFKELGGEQPVFIGQRASYDYKHEGYPGYSFSSFATDSRGYSYTIFDVPQGTNVSVEDIYSINDVVYTIKNIRTEGLDNKLRLRCESSKSSTLSETDSLVKKSGNSSSDNNILYSAAEKESGNPFWNKKTSSIDFAEYRKKMDMGNAKFDVIVIMLGTNDCVGGIKPAMQKSVKYAVRLIDSILDDAGDYPTKIILQLCPQDANTISSWHIMSDSSRDNASGLKIGYWNNIWALRRLLYTEFTKEKWKNKVYLGQAALGIDRYYGYPYTMVESSSRINIKEVFHDNSVHPNLHSLEMVITCR